MTTQYCTFHPDQNRISHRVLSPGRRSKWLSIMGHVSCYVSLGKKLWIEMMILPCQTSCVVVVRREDHFTLHLLVMFLGAKRVEIWLASSIFICVQMFPNCRQHRAAQVFTHVTQSLKAHVTSSLMNIWFGSCDSLAHLVTQAKSDHFTMPSYNIYGSLTFWCIKSNQPSTGETSPFMPSPCGLTNAACRSQMLFLWNKVLSGILPSSFSSHTRWLLLCCRKIFKSLEEFSNLFCVSPSQLF